MIIKKNNELRLSEQKVKYIQHGVEIEQIVGEEGIQWWNDFAEKWEHTNIVEFINIEYTAEQLGRFEEIKELDIADNIANDYVMDGVVSDGVVSDGLGLFILKKENKDLKKLLADLTEEILMKDGE